MSVRLPTICTGPSSISTCLLSRFAILPRFPSLPGGSDEGEIGDGSEFKSLWWNHPQHTSLPCSFSQPRVDLIDGETSQGFELLA